MAQADEGIQVKIRKLLNHAEKAGSEAEAQTYVDKARELMDQYDVTMEEVRKSGTDASEKIVGTWHVLPTKTADRRLWGNIAYSRGVQVVDFVGRGKMHLIGYQSDLDFVELLVTTLMLQREVFVLQEYVPWGENVKSFRHAFRHAFATRVLHRIIAARRISQQASTTGTSTALVLVDKAARVELELNRLYPKLGKSAKVKIRESAGTYAGQRAADRADVSGGRNNLGSNSRALPRV